MDIAQQELQVDGVTLPGPSAEGAVGALLPDLLIFAVAMTGDRHLAEDVVVEAIARSLPRLRRGSIDNPGAYLRKVVVNQLRSWGRRRQVERRYAERHHHDARAYEPHPPPHAGVDDRLRLAPHVLRLPPRQRAIVALRFLEDRSVADVAALLGIKEGTVKSQTAKALATLRSILEDDRD